jgi:hypothetical protein
MCNSYCNSCNYCVSQCTCSNPTLVTPASIPPTGCISTNYARCIYYSGNAITCGITAANGENLDVIVNKLATAICSLTPADLNWASFNYQCLREDGSLTSSGPSNITTAKEFVEATSIALCGLASAVDVTPNITIPGSCSAYFSGLIPGTSTLVNILDDFIVKLCGLNSFNSTSGVSPAACWTSWTPLPSGVNLGSWITWIQNNVCTITFNLDTEITALQTFQSNIQTFIGTSVFPYTFNNSGACLGGSGADNLIQTINHIKNRLCSLYTASLTPFSSNILVLPWSSYSCLWPGYLDSATLSAQGASIVDALADRTLNFSSDFTVTPSGSGCGFDVAFTVPPTPFTCSSLSTCSIKNLADVDATMVPSSQSAVLAWNGSSWTSKVVSVTSTTGSCSITTTAGANINFDINFTLNPTTTANPALATPVALTVGTPAGGVTPVTLTYNPNSFSTGSSLSFIYALPTATLAVANSTTGPIAPSPGDTFVGWNSVGRLFVDGQVDLVVSGAGLGAGTVHSLGNFGAVIPSLTTYWSSGYFLVDLVAPGTYPIFVGMAGSSLSIQTIAAIPAGTYTLSLSGFSAKY